MYLYTYFFSNVSYSYKVEVDVLTTELRFARVAGQVTFNEYTLIVLGFSYVKIMEIVLFSYPCTLYLYLYNTVMYLYIFT